MEKIGKKGAFSPKILAGIFAAVSFLTGFLLIDRGSISGNAIVTSEPSAGAVSIIGLVLVFLSVVLAAYSIRK